MLNTKNILRTALMGSTAFASYAQAQEFNGLEQAKNLSGCYSVDYSYSETKVLNDAYEIDTRVYDSSRFIVKELVKVVDEGQDHVRLQHFMSAETHDGVSVFKMRHHGEMWQRSPAYRYEYDGRFEQANDRWTATPLEDNPDQWLRVITNLDDGLRYQCLGNWTKKGQYPVFNCAAFSPIPGRETRDMGRDDYQTLDRKAEITIHGDSWLERQSNVKTVFNEGGRTPLVQEVGKIWSVRLPDSACNELSSWVEERQAFWDILADVWQETLDGQSDFSEVTTLEDTSRMGEVSKLFNQYFKTVTTNHEHAVLVRNQLKTIIANFRK